MLVCFVCLKESTCETKKNDFYFTSKAPFVFERDIKCKKFRTKKCLQILAPKIFCSPNILTSEIALNEKILFLFF